MRFRELATEDGPLYIAWFEPTHHIARSCRAVLRAALRRDALVDPDAGDERATGTAMSLRFGPGASRSDAPDGDALEALWRTYYASIFNPARLKTRAMRAHMPKKYWANLPEAELIPG